MKQNKARMVTASFVVAFVTILFGATAICAQTTSFTYQGRLTDGGTPANGNYDLQLALFDSLSAGSQIGATQSFTSVAVSNGTFSVSVDFGESAFPGANRFLEISARPSGPGSFTTLSPRQPITSTPYAVRALNATNEIHNSTSQQPNTNFNISGNGTAARYNLPAVGSIVPFLGLNGTSVGLCGADGYGTILGCFINTDLSGAPTTITTTIDAETLTLKGNSHLTLNSSAAIDLNSNSAVNFNVPSVNVSNNVSIAGTLTVQSGINGPLIVNGNLTAAFPSAGSAPLCTVPMSGFISFCSSSLRYKKEITSFAGGLNILNRLRPITFTWKDRPERDLGLGAEDVAAVEPLLTFRNSKGEIEGVKYDKLTVVLINSIKEQQQQIDKQQKEIEQMRKEIRHLRATNVRGSNRR